MSATPSQRLPTLPISVVAGLASSLLFACPGQDPDGTRTGLYTGYVEARWLHIAAPSAGWITRSHVREGDSVEVGDPLFELEAELQDAQLEEAARRLGQFEAEARDLSTGAREEEIEPLEGQLAEARANRDLAALERRRSGTLAAQGVVSQDAADRAIAEHEVAEARVRTLEADIAAARLSGRRAARDAALATAEAAEAAVRQARWHRDERRVRARATGRVEEIFYHPGEFVPAASPVLSVQPEDALEIHFFVPQKDLSRVAPGTEVQVSIDGHSGPISARVVHVASQAEFTPPVIYSVESREKLVFLVKASVGDSPGSPALRAGQPVDVRLP